jgi:hypothetical protein
MSFRHTRPPLIAAFFVGSAVLAGGWIASDREADGSPGGGPAEPRGPGDAKPAGALYGKSACIKCHNNEKEPPEDKKNPSICLLTEMPIWEAKDKHGIAYAVLKSQHAQDMGKLLGWKDVSADARCVSCHSVLAGAKQQIDPTFDRAEGVSCVACHGPDNGWVDMHGAALAGTRKKWRGLPRNKKEVDYGMIDLWDPVKRTRLCASCHIGNAREGKVVTHDMYAAGHPPLPGFEPATFSDFMPRHWQYLKDKRPEIQALLKFDLVEAKLEETNLVLGGGMVAFEQFMNLIADLADSKSGWPEFAVFDCYSCHHDLKSKSWRQERGYRGQPGRPPMRSWPTTLLGLEASSGNSKVVEQRRKDLHQKLGQLHKTFTQQPFGEPSQVATSARGLAAWAGEEIKSLRERKADPEDAKRLLKALDELKQAALADYDSARQLAWACAVLQREANPAAAREVQRSSQWQALDRMMNLSLPIGRKEIMKSLPGALRRINEYQPAVFSRDFEAILKLFHELAARQGSTRPK